MLVDRPGLVAVDGADLQVHASSFEKCAATRRCRGEEEHRCCFPRPGSSCKLNQQVPLLVREPGPNRASQCRGVLAARKTIGEVAREHVKGDVSPAESRLWRFANARNPRRLAATVISHVPHTDAPLHPRVHMLGELPDASIRRLMRDPRLGRAAGLRVGRGRLTQNWNRRLDSSIECRKCVHAIRRHPSPRAKRWKIATRIVAFSTFRRAGVPQHYRKYPRPRGDRP